MKPGEFILHQPGVSDPVGWVRVNSDRTVEWWAYVDETYSWGDSSNNSSAPWHLDAEYLGNASYGSYAVWKAAVLQRAAAQEHTVVFQTHAVAEETVAN